jgi:hypothetical protein
VSPSPRLAQQQQQQLLQQQPEQRVVQATQSAPPLQQQQLEQQEEPEQGEDEAYADDFGASAEDTAAAGIVEAPVSVKRHPSVTSSHPPLACRTYSDAAVGSDASDNSNGASTGASVLSAEEQYVRAEATRIQAHYLAQAARITASSEISPPPPGNPAARMAWPTYEEAKEEQHQQQPQQQARVPVVVGRGNSAAALQAPRRPFAAAPSATPTTRKQHKRPMPVPASLSAQRSPLYQPLRVKPEEASYWATAAANANANAIVATSPSASSVQQPYLPQQAEHAVPYPPYHAHYYKATAANASPSMSMRPSSAKR